MLSQAVYAQLVEEGMEKSDAVREAIRRVKGAHKSGSLLAAAAEEPAE